MDKRRLLWVAYAVWIALCAEALSRADGAAALGFLDRHALLFGLNALLVACLLLLVGGATGRGRLAFWVVLGLAGTAAAVSGTKLRLKGAPLLPWDLALVGETASVVNWKDVASAGLLAGIPVGLVLSYLLAHRLPDPATGLRPRGRVIMAGGAALVLAGLCFGQPAPVLRALGDQAMPWDQVEHVRSQGFGLALVHNLQLAASGGRPRVDTQAAAVVAKQFAVPDGAPGNAGPVQPNVVVILSESFWDPTRMQNLSFSPDPIPTYHALAQRYTSGWLLSPEFGGSTANVEMEVLTGLSMRFLPDGVLAYEKYIDHPVDSLASILSRQGYSATAISPWPQWYFNAKAVYRNFGFGKYISSEFIDDHYEHPYIPDSVITQLVEDEVDRTPGPHFVFANTAENHYGYHLGKFPENTVKVTGLSGEVAGNVATYAEGCRRADQMLKALTDHFTATKTPTILVWFGDHLPVLGNHYQAYQESGYITGEEDPDFLRKMHQVPVLVWNNFLPEHRDDLNLSPSFLLPYLLEQAKVPSTPFSQLLREQAKQTPVIPPQRSWPEFGVTDVAVKAYQVAEQDILFGEGQIYGEARGRIVNPDFVLGFGPMRLTEVRVEDAPEGPVVAVRGENLPPTGVIFLDGKGLPTTRGPDGTLRAKAPATNGEVQVKVWDADHKELTVAESITVSILH